MRLNGKHWSAINCWRILRSHGMTLLTSKSDFSGLASCLTRKGLSQGKVKLNTSTSHVSGHPLKLTLIRLKGGTLLEAKPRWLPSTPEQEDVYDFITSMKSNPLLLCFHNYSGASFRPSPLYHSIRKIRLWE